MRPRPAPWVAQVPRAGLAVAAGAGAALLLALGVASGAPPQRYAVPAAVAGAADAELAAAAVAPPPPADTSAGGRPADASGGDGSGAGAPGGGDGEVDAAEVDASEGRLGGLVLQVADRFSGPLGPAEALPPTTLEAQEPTRLYALVTRAQPVAPLRYAPDDLVALPGGLYEARAEVAEQVRALMTAAREAGHGHLVVTSGFRAYETQAGTHEDWVRRLGAERAAQVSAVPGHSEHQLGLAVDLAGECGGYQCFGASADGLWVADNAHRFGFVVRYPQGGRAVTGYAYEPWHLRYVGPRAAWAMHLQGEAYWERFAPVALEAADSGD